MVNSIYWSIILFDKLSLDVQTDVTSKIILFHFLDGSTVVAAGLLTFWGTRISPSEGEVTV
jgi:hypothetical protein